MNYLQQYLNEIAEKADEAMRLAHANAALVELAGEVMARINAAAQRDVVYQCYHFRPADLQHVTKSEVTLQQHVTVSNDELIDALDAAGFPVCQLPVRLDSWKGERLIYLLIAPGVELLMHPPVPRVADAIASEEVLPCAA